MCIRDRVTTGNSKGKQGKVVKVFPKDKEMAIKQASERRIIDVV